jgi:hypothetical protein
MQTSTKTRQAAKALEKFERMLDKTCIEKSLAKNLQALSHRSRRFLDKGDLAAADSVLTTAMLGIKRNLGTEISLREGFELSSIIAEDVRRHIADPAVLLTDACDFATGFFRIYSDHEYRHPGLPDYMMQRPFPKAYKNAARELINVIEGFELPKTQAHILVSDIKAIEKFAPAFSHGKASAADLYTNKVLITNFCLDLAVMQGVFLSEYQIATVLGLMIFAIPGWLCYCPAAWIAQAIIVAIGLIAYGIYKGMNYAESKKAYKDTWTLVEDCTKTPLQASIQFNKDIANLNDDQLKDLKKALEKTLQEVRNDNIPFSGNKGKVIRKLQTLINLL